MHADVLIPWPALVAAVLMLPRAGQAQAGAGDWAAVDAALGRPGKAQPGNVQKYTFPRSDLHVVVGDVVVKPALALTSWVAFRRTGRADGGAMVLGDLVLTEDELPAVLAKLPVGGVRRTALHNHLQHESPRVMYLHVEGSGDPASLAAAIRTALAATATPTAAPAPAAPDGAPFPLDTAALARTLQRAGAVNGGVFQVSVPRAGAIRMHGLEIPAAMGVASAINFQPTGNGNAAVTGDLVLTPDEVDPVLQALEGQGIAVTALHGHMLEEEPRLLFMHFWATADALRLARSLRTALDRTRSKRAAS